MNTTKPCPKKERLVLIVSTIALAIALIAEFFLTRLNVISAILFQGCVSAVLLVAIYSYLNTSHRAALAPLTSQIGTLSNDVHAKAREISELSEQLQSVFEVTEEALIVVETPNRLLAANKAAYHLFGLTKEKESRLQASLNNIPALRALTETCLFRGHADLEQFSALIENREIILSARARRFALDSKNGVVIALRDLTSLRKMENLKKNFVANVSHELRTPVQIVKGYAELLSDTEISEEYKNWARIIEHQSMRMERIVADLLMLAKLEHNPSSWIVKERFTLIPVLQEAAHTVHLQFPSAGAIELECMSDMEVFANAGLIEQAVFNLMANAVQHSGSKEKIVVSALQDKEEIVIRVRDFGSGIPARDLEHIFERFYRASSTRSAQDSDQASVAAKSGGSGLGLAIVKHIAVAHGGTVRAESWANEGSIFEFRIPQFKEDESDVGLRADPSSNSTALF